jgi:hypothetical protein
MLLALKDLLNSNQRVACAIGEIPARFIAAEASFAEAQLSPAGRYYVDTVLNQDRGRLLAAMCELLDATVEYMRAIDCGLRSSPPLTRARQ